MKKIIYLLASFTALLATSCDNPADDSIRVGSYNLWRSDLGKNEYAWEHRKVQLARSIADVGFDIFGIQEADLRIQEELPALTGEYTDKYAWWFFSPYSQDGNGDKAQGIVYDSTRFSMKESHYFWLSETPDTMSSAWDEKKYNRGACCFIFNDKNTGKDFFAMVIHAPLAKEASAKCVDVVMQQYEKYNPDGLPAVFVGDFNAKPDSPASKQLREYWTDSFDAVPAEARKGSTGTFNGHNIEKDMEKARRIDYVYFRGEGIEPLAYECVNTQYDGIWPSDHCPIYAVLKMK